MNRKTGERSRSPRAHALLAAGILAAGLCLAATAANASPITINASIGGVPGNSGNICYVNFDALATGNAGGTAAGTGTGCSTGIGVAFGSTAQAVTGSASGAYAAPYLSNNNGTPFGDVNDGQDGTVYLTTGTGSVTLTLPSSERYLGLLWGSVDKYNTLKFYDGGTLIQSFTGSNVSASADGNQGASGTFYVNFNSSMAFNKIVATSTSNAFEFDNVAFSVSPIGVPEPGTAGIFLLGLALVGSGIWLRRRRTA